MLAAAGGGDGDSVPYPCRSVRNWEVRQEPRDRRENFLSQFPVSLLVGAVSPTIGGIELPQLRSSWEICGAAVTRQPPRPRRN